MALSDWLRDAGRTIGNVFKYGLNTKAWASDPQAVASLQHFLGTGAKAAALAAGGYLAAPYLTSLLASASPSQLAQLGGAMAGLLSSAAGNRAYADQAALDQQLLADAQQRYNQNYQLLSSELADILSADYRAIPQEQIDRIVAASARDIAEQQARASEQILRDQARRGLAGHSLVDQRQAYVDRQAQQALADTRLRAETEADRLTQQAKAQARSLLAGLTSENLAAQLAAARDLRSNLQQTGSTFTDLAGTLLGSLDWSNWRSWLPSGGTDNSSGGGAAGTASYRLQAPMPSRIKWGR